MNEETMKRKQEELELDILLHPYDHCSECEYRGNKCKVWDRFQRLPRNADGSGGLGLCIKIGGHGS